MFKTLVERSKYKSILFVILGWILTSSTASSAPSSLADDSYCGLYREQRNGSIDTFRVTRLPNGSYRFKVHGAYATNLGGNFGDADCKSKIVNNLAALKQKDWKDSGIYILFKNDQALVVQNGTPSDVGFGNNVNVTGIYKRTNKHPGPKLLNCLKLNGAHYERADGTPAFPGTFESAQTFREGRAAVTSHGKSGFIDSNGKLVVPYKFSDAHEFYEGLAAVSLDGQKWGYIDKAGIFIVKPIYDYAWDFSEGRGAVAIGKDFFWIDKNSAKVISKNWDRVLAFKNNVASVEKNDHWGLVNKNGEEIIATKYAGPILFHEGLAAFENDSHQQGYLDSSGQEVIGAQYYQAGHFSEGLAHVQRKMFGPFAFIDKNGAAVTAEDYSEVFGNFVDGQCFVRRKGSPIISIIDKSGKTIKELPLQIQDITSFDEESESKTLMCRSLDFNWDSNGHYLPIKRDGIPLQAFAGKDVKYWAGEGMYVVSGAALNIKSAAINLGSNEHK